MLSTLFVLSASSLIGIDIGTEYIRGAVLRAGRSIEIVLNEQSKRKTPCMVSMEGVSEISVENIRRIDARLGSAAAPALQRNRSAVIRGFTEILGKNESLELQNHLSNRLYDLTLQGLKVNGIFPEIPLALLISDLAKQAEQQLQEGQIKEAVVAVPAFFTNAQRIAVAKAVKLSGLRLLKIIDDKTALSFVYALEKTSMFAKDPKTVAIVDFGSGFLRISGFKFSTKVIQEKGRKPKPIPHAEDILYLWDDQVGGMDFDIRIARRLMGRYNLPTITTSLLEDAQKIKHALTLGDIANVTTEFSNERVIFTKDELLSCTEDLFERIRNLCLQAGQKFDAVEFVGGASRITGVQDTITSILGASSRSLNADESLVNGAAYIAASSSKAFKILDIVHNPLNVHDIGIQIGDRVIKLFNNASLLTKTKTARLSNLKSPTIELNYQSKVPVGCVSLIHQFDVTDYQNNNDIRVALTVGFSERSTLKVPKVVLFSKLPDNSVSQSQINLKLLQKPYSMSDSDEESARSLMSAFNSHFTHQKSVAEAQNTLESALFEAREAITRDPIWMEVTTEEEKEEIIKTVDTLTEWIHEHSYFEDEREIQAKIVDFDQTLKDIRFKVQERRLRSQLITKLDTLIEDIMDALKRQWPEKGLIPPKIQKKALKTLVKSSKMWFDQKKKEQNKLLPTDTPVLLTSELEARINRLSEQYRSLEETAFNAKLRREKEGEDL